MSQNELISKIEELKALEELIKEAEQEAESLKDEIKSHIEKNYDYDLSFSLDEIRPYYDFDVSCQGSVPESIVRMGYSDIYLHVGTFRLVKYLQSPYIYPLS